MRTHSIATLKRVLGPLLFTTLLGSAAAHDPAAAFRQENDAAMQAMMAKMHAEYTGDVDRDFITMMIPHHQGAIDMAEAQLKYGRDEQLKRLSRAIVAKQRDEIAEMQRLLASTPAKAGTGTDTDTDTAAHHEGMHHQH